MNDSTHQLADDAHALAVKPGAVLVEAERFCNSGSPDSAKALAVMAGKINRLSGMLNCLYYAAKATLEADEFEDFCRVSKIDRALVEDGLRGATDEFVNAHYELSEN